MSITLGRAITVDTGACIRVAAILRSHSIPDDREDATLKGLTRQQIGNFYLVIVAICHRTSPRGKLPLEGTVQGRRLKGWDYLSARFEEQVRSKPDLLVPSTWSRLTAGDIRDLFRDPDLGERLTDPGGRAALVRDLGNVMSANNWFSADDIYSYCRGRIARDSPNLFETLASFAGFRDPVRKKSCFFLSIMRNTGSWEYQDPENLGPPVDYHETRGHLRLGTVVVQDEELKRKLFESLPVTPEEDVAIRKAVYDAIVRISQLAGIHNASRLHYLFWNFFRSCCTHESPHCQACPPGCSLPYRYIPLATRTNGDRFCPFAEACASAKTPRRYYEQVIDTDFY